MKPSHQGCSLLVHSPRAMRCGMRMMALACALQVIAATGAAAQTLPWPSEQPQQRQGPAWPGEGGGPPTPTQAAAPAPAPAAPMMVPPQAGMSPGFGAPMSQRMAPPGAAEQQQCAAEFTRLRGEVEKRGQVAKAISERKGSREELCKAITHIFQAETTWVTFSRKNAARCGIPPDFIKQLGVGHNNLAKTRKTICEGGATAGPPPPPSLSEALGTARAPAQPTTTRRGGTMDTLVGNPVR